MRVAHIITRLIIGGAQENTLFNVDDQHHLFHDDVCLITGPTTGPEGSLERRAKERGLDLRLVPELLRSINPLSDWNAFRALKRELRAYRPELVHTHSSKAGILGRLAAHQLDCPRFTQSTVLRFISGRILCCIMPTGSQKGVLLGGAITSLPSAMR